MFDRIKEPLYDCVYIECFCLKGEVIVGDLIDAIKLELKSEIAKRREVERRRKQSYIPLVEEVVERLKTHRKAETVSMKKMMEKNPKAVYNCRKEILYYLLVHPNIITQIAVPLEDEICEVSSKTPLKYQFVDAETKNDLGYRGYGFKNLLGVRKRRVLEALGGGYRRG